MASYRYRTKIPADYIGAQINEGVAETIVFSKPMKGDLELAQQAKDAGAKIVVDVCDPHDYSEILKLADLVVSPTKVMASQVGGVVIPDPYEMPEVPPHANGDNFLWFGHNVNLNDIAPYAKMDNLRIVSGPKVGEGITHWSPENIDRAMREANIALFPTRKGAEYKSPNRLLNAVRTGLFPVCQTHPSYEEFKGMAWVGEMPTGIKWAKHFKHDLNGLVSQLQDHIRDKYSPKSIGEQWKDALGSI